MEVPRSYSKFLMCPFQDAGFGKATTQIFACKLSEVTPDSKLDLHMFLSQLPWGEETLAGTEVASLP